MIVFITGASSGIGKALAHQYAEQGAILGLVARRSELLQELADGLDTTVVTYPLDVRDADALATAAANFIERFGIPDIVIANAGVSRGTLTESKADTVAFKAIMDINLMGMLHTFQPFIVGMQRRGSGNLAGIASIAGIRGLPGAGAYSASKAAAINYLESLRVEMRPYGIHVTTIAPGYIKTPMTDVNNYSMPFLMDVDVAAKKMVRAIATRRRFFVVPWQMGMLARAMRLIPPSLWDWIMKNVPKKAHLDWDWL